MWITILAEIIFVAGTAAIIGLIIKVALLTVNFVMGKIREKLAVRAGRKVFMSSVAKLAQEISAEAERTGNIHKVDDLMRAMGDKGVAIAAIDSDGTVDEDDIQIYSANSVDDKLSRLLADNNGELVIN